MCDSSAKARVVPPITRVVASAVDITTENSFLFNVDVFIFPPECDSIYIFKCIVSTH